MMQRLCCTLSWKVLRSRTLSALALISSFPFSNLEIFQCTNTTQAMLLRRIPASRRLLSSTSTTTTKSRFIKASACPIHTSRARHQTQRSCCRRKIQKVTIFQASFYRPFCYYVCFPDVCNVSWNCPSSKSFQTGDSHSR